MSDQDLGDDRAMVEMAIHDAQAMVSGYGGPDLRGLVLTASGFRPR